MKIIKLLKKLLDREHSTLRAQRGNLFDKNGINSMRNICYTILIFLTIPILNIYLLALRRLPRFARNDTIKNFF